MQYLESFSININTYLFIKLINVFKNPIRTAVKEELLARKHLEKPSHLWRPEFGLHPLWFLALVFMCVPHSALCYVS
jgi:hypothetical protein